MEKIVSDMLAPVARSFISDWGFALAMKVGKWLDARIPSMAVRAVLGLLLGLTTIFLIVIVTGLAGF